MLGKLSNYQELGVVFFGKEKASTGFPKIPLTVAIIILTLNHAIENFSECKLPLKADPSEQPHCHTRTLRYE
jgi:hypothetical protein